MQQLSHSARHLGSCPPHCRAVSRRRQCAAAALRLLQLQASAQTRLQALRTAARNRCPDPGMTGLEAIAVQAHGFKCMLTSWLTELSPVWMRNACPLALTASSSAAFCSRPPSCKPSTMASWLEPLSHPQPPLEVVGGRSGREAGAVDSTEEAAMLPLIGSVFMTFPKGNCPMSHNTCKMQLRVCLQKLWGESHSIYQKVLLALGKNRKISHEQETDSPQGQSKPERGFGAQPA